MKRLITILALAFAASMLHAEVVTNTFRTPFNCTGSTGPYAFTFPINDPTALSVTQNTTVLNPATDYTVVPVNNSYSNGGSVTLTAACPSGQTLVVARNTPVTQARAFADNMPKPMKQFEAGLDKLTEILQETNATVATKGGTGSCSGAAPYVGAVNTTGVTCIPGTGSGGGGGGGSVSGYIDVTKYGAKADAQAWTDGVILPGALSTLTSATGGFTPSTCVQKKISIQNAGAIANDAGFNYAQPLVTTCTYVDAHTLTLGTPANQAAGGIVIDSGVTLTNHGTSGYTTASGLATTTTGSGTGAVVSITASGGTISSGTFNSVPGVVATGGHSYAVGDKIYPSQPGASGDAYFTVTAVSNTGFVIGTDNMASFQAWAAALSGQAGFIPAGAFLLDTQGNTQTVTFGSNETITMQRGGVLYYVGAKVDPSGAYLLTVPNNSQNVVFDSLHISGENLNGLWQYQPYASNSGGGLQFLNSNFHVKVINSLFENLFGEGISNFLGTGGDVDINHNSFVNVANSGVNANSDQTNISYNYFIDSAAFEAAGAQSHYNHNTIINGQNANYLISIGGKTGGDPTYTGSEAIGNTVLNPRIGIGCIAIADGFTFGTISNNICIGLSGAAIGINNTRGDPTWPMTGNNLIEGNIISGNSTSPAININGVVAAPFGRMPGDTLKNNVVSGTWASGLEVGQADFIESSGNSYTGVNNAIEINSSTVMSSKDYVSGGPVSAINGSSFTADSVFSQSAGTVHQGSLNLATSTAPLLLQGSAGTTGQAPVSQGPGATPIWGQPSVNTNFPTDVISPSFYTALGTAGVINPAASSTGLAFNTVLHSPSPSNNCLTSPGMNSGGSNTAQSYLCLEYNSDDSSQLTYYAPKRGNSVFNPIDTLKAFTVRANFANTYVKHFFYGSACFGSTCSGATEPPDGSIQYTSILLGPASAPSGACTTVGWSLNGDGTATWCNGSVWSQPLSYSASGAVNSINGTSGAYTFNFSAGAGSCSGTTCTFTGSGAGGGSVTNFIASAASWPTWLVPSVATSTTTPTLSVSASAIPNAALANPSTTVNGITCTLGSTCTVTSAGVGSFTGDGALLNNSASTGAVTATLANAGAHTVWGNRTGSTGAPSYGVLVSADIPNNAANTSGNAATATALAASPTNCSAGQAPQGINASGTAQNCTTYAQVICSGTIALSTGAIALASTHDNTATCTGLLTTDNIQIDFASDPTAVTGYGVSGNVLTIYKFPTANTIHVVQGNNANNSGSITPGAITVNYRVWR